jgi:uncharacterized FlaG/YvyC family protein
LSVNTPTACSSDRYKYRFGYSGGRAHGQEQVIYKRPAPAPKSSMSQRKTEHQPLLDVYDNDNNGDIVDNVDNGTNICSIYCMNNNISNISRKVSEIEDTINDTNKMILMNRQLREKHEKHEKREIYEKENEERLKKEKEKQPEINRKLGKIIYRSRTGDLFEAHHSVQMTVVFVFDKKTGQSTQTLTQKIVWEDKVFETKQDWFSEMARSSAQRADENMKVLDVSE